LSSGNRPWKDAAEISFFFLSMKKIWKEIFFKKFLKKFGKTLAILEEAAKKLLRIWKIPPWNSRPHFKNEINPSPPFRCEREITI